MGHLYKRIVSHSIIFLSAVVLCCSWVYMYWTSVHQISDQLIYTHVDCLPGNFKFENGKNCTPWLQCPQIRADIHTLRLIGQGAVKKVYLGDWRGYQVAVSKLASLEYRMDFLHGLSMLKVLQNSLVVQLVGFCLEDHTIVTKHHPHGSLLNLENIFSQEEYHQSNNWFIRLRLATDYVAILHYLHNSPAGRRVMCDSNSLEKTLSQFLLTDDFHVIVNDLDALPEVNPSTGLLAKCGHLELTGEFVAPEQIWPFKNINQPFSDDLMPAYDEKTDIWKIPDVTQFIMGNTPGGDLVHFHLFQVHTKCKNKDPKLRPSAYEVLKVYKSVYSTVVQENNGS